MSYLSIDFAEVRRLVYRWERGSGIGGSAAAGGDENSLPTDDVRRFLSSDEVNRATLAICSLRERASAVTRILDGSFSTDGLWISRFGDTESTWFNDEAMAALESIVPISVAYCPDLLTPEVLVNSLVTTKFADALLKSCTVYSPILTRKFPELLGDFILKYVKGERANSLETPLVSLSLLKLTSLCRAMPDMAAHFREVLVRRHVGVNIVIQITIEDIDDVAEFLLRILFADKVTSKWFLSCMDATSEQNKPDCISSDKRSPGKAVLTPLEMIESRLLIDTMVLHLRECLLKHAEAAFSEHGWNNKLYCHLKIYCFLVCRGGWQPLHEEVVFWLSALTCVGNGSNIHLNSRPCEGCISRRMLELGSAFLFLVPGLSSIQTASQFQDCLKFLLGSAISGSVCYEGGPEVAIWLLVQLLLQCNDRVSEFVSKAIGADLIVDAKHWREVCRTAHDSGVTSNAKDITIAASCVRPSGPVCGTRTPQYSLECLFQLSKSGHFVRCMVDIAEAVMRCILLSQEPIHPMLVELIEMFAEASCGLSSVGCRNAYKMKPLPYGFLIAVIKPFSSYSSDLENILAGTSGETICLQKLEGGEPYGSSLLKVKSAGQAVLASFFVLCKELLEQEKAKLHGGHVTTSNSKDGDEIWWSKLLTSLPLKCLLALMENNWSSYEHIFPRWAGMAVYLFPERLQVFYRPEDLEELRNNFTSGDKNLQLWKKYLHVKIDDHSDSSIADFGHDHEIVRAISESGITIETAPKILRNSSENCMRALKLIEAIHIGNLPRKNVFELQVVVMQEVLSLMLKGSCPQMLQERFCEWWCSLEHIDVEVLLPVLYRYISSSTMDSDGGICIGSSNANLGFPSMSVLYQDLVEQPLSFLAFKKEVYYTSLLSVCLDLMMELLVKNRSMCLLAVEGEDETKRKEVLKILDTRDSAVCQILLENWLDMISCGIIAQKESTVRTGQHICLFISSLFFSNPTVFRLVHFQVGLYSREQPRKDAYTPKRKRKRLTHKIHTYC
ncbi:uncharacterized protein LOC116250992 isoform X2 [Nymphaea colorata]|uniref:uncharacterized protein LOC116250992 isoform X2 n=1 Tax=Nymphaea colorata TaxID=210225 RepID=UPI00129DAB89|nr:uncharacterized protein LOC116250992 isoform X2 [Nymphaea colorata]